jgi:hypothetical protein
LNDIEFLFNILAKGVDLSTCLWKKPNLFNVFFVVVVNILKTPFKFISGRVIIEDLEEEAVAEMLRYIYTGHVHGMDKVNR